MATERDSEGLAWQRGVWDQMAPVYLNEVDQRFAPVVDQVIRRAGLAPGLRVLDLGTGTGAVALRAAPLVAPDGWVNAVDISPAMLAVAGRQAAAAGLTNVSLQEGRGEAIPAADGSFDTVLASLSLMYALDRAAAAHEIARVLRPGGRLVAAAWAGPAQCDIVLFQQTAGRAAPPPVPGVGPGALADAGPFLAHLADAGITATVETETLGFSFDDLATAWVVLAGVTAATLTADQQREAQAAIRATMWPDPRQPRHFRNLTQFILGERRL